MTVLKHPRWIVRLSPLLAALALTAQVQAQDIKIGLVAALTGPSAQSGEAITRGLSIAIDEINAKGGILGRKIELEAEILDVTK